VGRRVVLAVAGAARHHGSDGEFDLDGAGIGEFQ